MFVSPLRLSPATKLVLKILQLNGWLNQEEIVRETYLPSRTVKYAIRNLREKDIIVEKLDPDDLRRKYYRLGAKSAPMKKFITLL